AAAANVPEVRRRRQSRRTPSRKAERQRSGARKKSFIAAAGVTAAAANVPEVRRRRQRRRTPEQQSGAPAERCEGEIGVPRFELGTSPTRTERATRLRHTPTAATG